MYPVCPLEIHVRRSLTTPSHYGVCRRLRLNTACSLASILHPRTSTRLPNLQIQDIQSQSPPTQHRIWRPGYLHPDPCTTPLAVGANSNSCTCSYKASFRRSRKPLVLISRRTDLPVQVIPYRVNHSLLHMYGRDLDIPIHRITGSTPSVRIE